MKVITINGNVGRDAETRAVGQDSVLSFSVGVNDGFGDKRRTIWYDVSLWGKRADKLAQHVTKGKKVVVVGEHGDREHNGKTYHTVRAFDVGFGGEKQQGGYDQSPAPAQNYQQNADFSDDIPFAPEFR